MAKKPQLSVRTLTKYLTALVGFWLAVFFARDLEYPALIWYGRDDPLYDPFLIIRIKNRPIAETTTIFPQYGLIEILILADHDLIFSYTYVCYGFSSAHTVYITGVTQLIC